MEKRELAEYIKAEAMNLGFDVCGIARAESVPEECSGYCNEWIENGRHGTMQYLERNREKRYNPTLLVEGCKSIVVVAMNYAPKQKIEGISRYAQGLDYHKVVKDRLFMLLERIKRIQPANGRPFCDSAPVLERFWAQEAGIGWIGRNRQLIIPNKGSYFFLGEVLLDIELEYDTPLRNNFCGNCRRCIDSCPSGALDGSGFDARRCLSYLTIEYRGELPENCGKMMNNCFYGCDSCQEACPHNRFSTPNNTAELQPLPQLLEMGREKWQAISKEEYDQLFAHSAVERCGYAQLKRNIEAWIKAEEQ